MYIHMIHTDTHIYKGLVTLSDHPSVDWKLRPQSTTRDAYALGSSLCTPVTLLLSYVCTNRRVQRVQHPVVHRQHWTVLARD